MLGSFRISRGIRVGGTQDILGNGAKGLFGLVE